MFSYGFTGGEPAPPPSLGRQICQRYCVLWRHHSHAVYVFVHVKHLRMFKMIASSGFLTARLHQMPFRPGAPSRTPLGELTTLPQTLQLLQRGLLLRGTEGMERRKGNGRGENGKGKTGLPDGNSWICP